MLERGECISPDGTANLSSGLGWKGASNHWNAIPELCLSILSYIGMVSLFHLKMYLFIYHHMWPAHFYKLIPCLQHELKLNILPSNTSLTWLSCAAIIVWGSHPEVRTTKMSSSKFLLAVLQGPKIKILGISPHLWFQRRAIQVNMIWDFYLLLRQTVWLRVGKQTG